MAKYQVQMVDSETSEVLEVFPEEFDSYEEAEEYCDVCYEDYSAGGRCLKLMGEPYGEDDVEFEVIEIDD